MTDTKRKDVLDGLEGYTPGPWVIDRPKPSEVHVLGYEDGGSRLVLVAACETEADARLIARAPELLAENRQLRFALQRARDHLVDLDSDASWMLNRSKDYWDENQINATLGEVRAFVQGIDTALPGAGDDQ